MFFKHMKRDPTLQTLTSFVYLPVSEIRRFKNVSVVNWLEKLFRSRKTKTMPVLVIEAVQKWTVCRIIACDIDGISVIVSN